MARRQFQSLFDVVFAGSVTANIANAATGSGTFGSVTVTVLGAAVGDAVFVFPTGGASTDGAPFYGEVSAANTVRIGVLNNSAGAVDQANQIFKIAVLRALFN